MLETHSTKATEVGESNKPEVSASGAQRGFGGATPSPKYA